MHQANQHYLLVRAQLEADGLRGLLEDEASVDEHDEVAVELLCDLDDEGDDERFAGRLVAHWQ